MNKLKQAIAYFKDAIREYEYTDHWVGMGNLCEVIAWMPLPEAPKE